MDSGHCRQGRGFESRSSGCSLCSCRYSVSSPLIVLNPCVHERSLIYSGQRCTSTRRVYLHTSIAKQFTEMLLKNYNSPSNLPIGDPLDPKTMIGPLHTYTSVERYTERLESIKKNGGIVLNDNSGKIGTLDNWHESSGGNWVRPAIAKPVKDDPCWKEEYVLRR
jgi:acyl-CoA reductase-like NAD-dependent aldehyde dehydrogenase